MAANCLVCVIAKLYLYVCLRHQWLKRVWQRGVDGVRGLLHAKNGLAVSNASCMAWQVSRIGYPYPEVASVSVLRILKMPARNFSSDLTSVGAGKARIGWTCELRVAMPVEVTK
jgi:hypothetical protein